MCDRAFPRFFFQHYTTGPQARDQLWIPGGAKSFPTGAHIFLTMSNIFKLRPKHFSRGGEKFSRGASPPWLWACWSHTQFILSPRSAHFVTYLNGGRAAV